MYELATDTETNIIYALMVDGEVKVYDAAGPLGGGGGGGCGGKGGPLWTSQVITHDPSPRSLGTETRGEYRRWRQRVGLDDNLGSGNRTTTTTAARLRCKAGARRLLRLQPRVKVLFPCPGTGILLVNSSAGDRCVRFHESAAMRRVCRTRLDLPPPPRSASTDGQGLFDVMEVLEGDGEEGGGGVGRSGGSGGGGSGGGRGGRVGMVGTTECSLLDVVFFPELSLLLGLVGGRAEVCTDGAKKDRNIAGWLVLCVCVLSQSRRSLRCCAAVGRAAFECRGAECGSSLFTRTFSSNTSLSYRSHKVNHNDITVVAD